MNRSEAKINMSVSDGDARRPENVQQRGATDPRPNELDQPDESRKGADIARAGEASPRAKDADPDCPGETPQSVTPCAPDGRNSERYAG